MNIVLSVFFAPWVLRNSDRKFVSRAVYKILHEVIENPYSYLILRSKSRPIKKKDCSTARPIFKSRLLHNWYGFKSFKCWKGWLREDIVERAYVDGRFGRYSVFATSRFLFLFLFFQILRRMGKKKA